MPDWSSADVILGSVSLLVTVASCAVTVMLTMQYRKIDEKESRQDKRIESLHGALKDMAGEFKSVVNQLSSVLEDMRARELKSAVQLERIEGELRNTVKHDRIAALEARVTQIEAKIDKIEDLEEQDRRDLNFISMTLREERART